MEAWHVCDEDGVVAVHKFFCDTQLGICLVPPDPDKAMSELMEVANEGYLIAAKIDGNIKGVMGLVKLAPWYSREKIWVDRFFVIEAFANPSVAKCLVRAARNLRSKERQTIVITRPSLILRGDGS